MSACIRAHNEAMPLLLLTALIMHMPAKLSSNGKSLPLTIYGLRGAGESFEGREQQYEWLYQKARALLGGSMTRSLLKGLVKSYLGLPMR
jgi:hypothetical protein